MARLVRPALALLLLGAASAFVPTLRSTTGWSPCSAGAHARPALGARARAAPLLHMNMFDRFTRVAKANANKLLEKMEDPEKVLSQAVEDLQKDLVAVRQSYAEVMATQKRMKSQKEQADALGDEWYSRAQLALTKGDDELAKEALTRRQTQVDTAESLASQLAIQEASLTKLYDSMTLLENKITEAKGMKDQMIARARTAKTATKVNDMLSSATGSTSMDAFDRMKEKVEMLESQAEVSAQLAGAPDASLEDKFKQLEAGDSVSDELERMKRALPGAVEIKGELTAGPVDDEIERMKAEIAAKNAPPAADAKATAADAKAPPPSA